MFFTIGLLDAVNGILIVYASKPTRTPPVLQAIFVNMMLFFSLPATKFLIKSKKNIVYCSFYPVASIICLLYGVLMLLLPTFISIVNGEGMMFENSQIIWCVVFILGVVPGALYNVLQEKFLERRKNETYRDIKADIFMMLFWGCFFQLIVILACFWTDIIQGFGFSDDFTSFITNLDKSLLCLFGGCETTWRYFLIFDIGYLISYLCQATLNMESANYGIIAVMLSSPVVGIVGVIFPDEWNQGDITTLYTAIPSLFGILVGTLFWKYWERKDYTLTNTFPINDN
eukprot:TRINITY_DN3728_c0_g1_i1.p1 TRINITY_DN3728_c0_g1~~TRINITY_DN3728_c0_g1_i1.p1  ORF type:complete len:286 (+),score=34.32 TRINITY_DN3728_c0_g1_i1:427-1284(+)